MPQSCILLMSISPSDPITIMYVFPRLTSTPLISNVTFHSLNFPQALLTLGNHHQLICIQNSIHHTFLLLCNHMPPQFETTMVITRWTPIVTGNSTNNLAPTLTFAFIPKNNIHNALPEFFILFSGKTLQFLLIIIRKDWCFHQKCILKK